MNIELDSILIKAQGEVQDKIHWWQIRHEASRELPKILRRTKALGSDLVSLPPAADTIFRTFVEWEIAGSVATQKGYYELSGRVERHYRDRLERMFKECGYRSDVVASHVFAPLNEIAKLVVKTDKFDPQTRQDLSSQVVKQVAEFYSRERSFHPLEQQLHSQSSPAESPTLPEKDLQFLEQVQKGFR